MSALILGGDCRASMRGLPAASIHACVTSIPYYALRSYGTEPQVWGGRDGCLHEWGEDLPALKPGQVPDQKTNHTDCMNGQRAAAGRLCGYCSAWRGELGLEPTVDLYIAHVVEVFAEVWRVLRKDGTCWLNVADSYSGTVNGRSAADTKATGRDDRTFRDKPIQNAGNGLKPKDLCLVPQRLALALQAAGWWVRCDVIWSKPNPMPESLGGWEWRRCRVKVAGAAQTFEGYGGGSGNRTIPDGSGGVVNAPRAEWAPCPGCPRCEPNGGLVLSRDSGRPTKAHEYLFLLAKSEQYFWDAEAVREAIKPESHLRAAYGFTGTEEKNRNGVEAHHGAGFMRSGGAPVAFNPAGRNLRSVWTINPQPFLGAHFATYPEELVRRCILASTSEAGCCPSCGAPYARVIEEGEPDREWQRACGADVFGGWNPKGGKDWEAEGLNGGGTLKARILAGMRTRKTTGWRPTCACAAGEPVPATVLDPFTGSGTTGLVAKKHGRSFIGCELKPQYAAMAEDRIGERGQGNLFEDTPTERTHHP